MFGKKEKKRGAGKCEQKQILASTVSQ